MAQRLARSPVVVAVVLAALSACSGTQTRPAAARVEVAYRFQCTPREARLVVDEVEQGACLLWEQQYLGLGAGTHRLRVEREGFLPVERELATTGRRETIVVNLRALPE